jgi:hypothetical protein
VVPKGSTARQHPATDDAAYSRSQPLTGLTADTRYPFAGRGHTLPPVNSRL